MAFLSNARQKLDSLFTITPGATPDDAARKRAILQEMFAGSAAPQSLGEGVVSGIGRAFGGWQMGKLDRAEGEKRKEASDGFRASLGRQQAAPLNLLGLDPAWGQGASFVEPQQPQQDGYSIQPGVAPGASTDLRSGIMETARAIGANPLDLATAISYETAGTFDPMKKGPTTQWGQHEGLIQFGQPQQERYGVDLSSREAALRSQLGPDGAIAKYLKSSGFKPGMSGLDLYSTINAGAPGRYKASDAGNGGAPGSVQDKWERQMADHRAKAAALLGGEAGGYDAPAMPPMPQVAAYSGPPIADLQEAVMNPWLSPSEKQMAATLLDRAMQQADPAYQMRMQQGALDLQKTQMEMAGMGQPGQVRPMEINGQLVDPTTGAVLGDYRDEAKASSGTEYGLNPQYGVDAQGNPVLIQIGKNGQAVQTAMPEGVKFQKEPIKLDAGTHFVLLDPITRQPVGQVPKDVQGVAAAETVGKAQGEAAANFGASMDKADLALKVAREIRDDPALPSVTGMFQGRLPPMSQEGTDLVAKIDQAKGQVFLNAYQMLKGGGAITDLEGTKAEQAIARMSRTQSAESYQTALDELMSVIETGKQRLAEKAGRQPPAPAFGSPSDDDALLRKYGG